MRLEAFRVQNYKKVRDTGWISCRDLTIFVGKNEAGKSAIFRGLSKLHPSDGEQYDGLKEFPRRRYTDEFGSQDWPVASARFALSEQERSKLGTVLPALRHTRTVTVTRHYSNGRNVEFDPPLVHSPVTGIELGDTIDSVVERVQNLLAPDGQGDVLGSTKQAVTQGLQQIKNGVAREGVIGKGHIEAAANAITQRANEEWQQKLLSPLVTPFRQLIKKAETHTQADLAKKWVDENLPKFIYFDRYDVIDSAIHIPSFVQQLANSPHNPRVRTTNCLFKHVGLDPKKLATLGSGQAGQPEDQNLRRRADERAILTASASNAMTSKFEDWWEQRRHVFRYQLDGDYFRIWVSDDLDPSEIELDQRSAGMQFFFSFYTVFLVEAAGTHVDSILLLDEPGLHLHGTAQGKVVKFLEKLSEKNQTMYTTHSPFMVDVDHLERARAVYEDPDGTTKVSEDIWPRDKDTLFPLQAALGYQLAQGLFISKRQIIVEGITDLWLLKALDQAMGERGLTRLRPEFVIVPSAGLTKLLPLASMLVGHDVEVAALLDGDEPARKEGRRLVDHLLAGDDRRCLFIGDFVSNANAETEDIFPEGVYLSAVMAAYPDINLNFTTDEAAKPGIVDKVEAFFARNNRGRFEKWKAAAILRDRILQSSSELDSTTTAIVESIFVALNALFPSDAC